jgi:acyl-coenzyme A thioesterase 13
MRDSEAVHEEWKKDGWAVWEGYDPFEHHVGPMFIKEVDGQFVSRLFVEKKHINGQGNLHGGMLMTFADYALFAIVRDKLMEQGAVTVTCNSEFIAAAQEGQILEAKGELVHETGRMLFVRGQIANESSTLLNFSGVLRKVKRKIQ